MNRHVQRESLFNALNYLQKLHDEFVDEIDLKTRDIRIHQAKKGTVVKAGPFNQEEKVRMQTWRRTSFALHQRRSTLKIMKDSLARQIEDVRMALDRMEIGRDRPVFDSVTFPSAMLCEMNYAQA